MFCGIRVVLKSTTSSDAVFFGEVYGADTATYTVYTFSNLKFVCRLTSNITYSHFIVRIFGMRSKQNKFEMFSLNIYIIQDGT